MNEPLFTGSPGSARAPVDKARPLTDSPHLLAMVRCKIQGAFPPGPPCWSGDARKGVKPLARAICGPVQVAGRGSRPAYQAWRAGGHANFFSS